MTDVFAQAERSIYGAVTAAPARRVSAADLANDLLKACLFHGVAAEEVVDLLMGVVPVAAPMTQQEPSRENAEQQNLPEHDQSPFK